MNGTKGFFSGMIFPISIMLMVGITMHFLQAVYIVNTTFSDKGYSISQTAFFLLVAFIICAFKYTLAKKAFSTSIRFNA